MTNSPGGFFLLDLDLWGGLSTFVHIDLDLWGGLFCPQTTPEVIQTQQKAGTPVPAFWSYLV